MSKYIVLLAACVLLFSAIGPCLAQAASVQNVGENAKIDWTNLVYIATGEGAMPSPQEEPNRARAKLKAKDYAKMAAIANLLMAVEGTTISYESTGKDYMADTTIRQKIEGFCKNVQITRDWTEKVEGSTIVGVEVRAPMFASNGPGTVFIKEAAKPEPTPTEEAPAQTVVETNVKVVLKPDKTTKVTTTTTVTPSAESTPYTGLIINCSGYKIDRCMSPKIRKQDGSEVWGTVRANYDLLQDHGIVAYTTSLAEAKKHSRAGSHPLIITAVGRAGGRFYSDAVISDHDAQVLMDENGKAGFLDKFDVVFVKDPKVY